MISFLNLLGIKLRIIAKRPLILIICLVLPILLTVLAGTTVYKNDYAYIDAAYVDLAKNGSSADLINLLSEGDVNWQERSMAEAERDLHQGELDGVVVIPENFTQTENAASAHEMRSIYGVEYQPGNNSVTSDIIAQMLKISLVTLNSEQELIDSLAELEQSKKMSVSDLRQSLKEERETLVEEGMEFTVNWFGKDKRPEGRILRIADYSNEVFFLSFLSLIAATMLSDRSTRRRMLSVDKALLRDYLSNIFAIALLLILQLFLMTKITQAIIPESSRPSAYFAVMLVLILMLLVYGQIVALFPKEQALIPAILFLLASLVLGGVYLNLPTIWMEKIGQFLPHGWVMARLNGIDTVMSLPLVIVLSIVILIATYFLQKSRRLLST